MEIPDRLGQQLGNYRLLRLLGTGGFAKVYLGEHIHLGTQAAIKVLHTQLTNEDVDKFRTEARMIARLIHAHTIRVLEFGIEGQTPFLVMDYAPNGTLRQRHPQGIALPFSLVIDYVQQVADALQYAHDEKLIHRDVKPENMLLGRHNEILLSDFGIALVAQNTGTQSTQEMAGTIAYMAPEQIQGKPRPASDQYSLGIIVYEWLTGERPFHGPLTELVGQHLSVVPPSLQEKVSTISPEVDRILQTALAKDPKQRFENIEAFANALRDAPPHSPSTPTIESLTRASIIPPEPVSQPPSSFQPEILVPALTETKPTYIKPATQTADTVTSSQMSTPVPYASPQNHHLITSLLSKRQRIAPILILLIIVLIGVNITWFLFQDNMNGLRRVWHTHTSGSSQDLLGIAWSGSLFVAVGTEGTIFTSSDGFSWTPRSSGSSQDLRGVAWSGSLFVAVGTEGTILTSPDGLSWTSRSSGTSLELCGIARSGPLFVAVGMEGTILTSPDGFSWTSRSSSTSLELFGITRSGSQFVAVGQDGIILTSPDGFSWTSQTSRTSQTLFSIASSSSQFVAVGTEGTILASPDGFSWTSQTSRTSQELFTIVSSGSQFVAVGTKGTILTSPDGFSWTSRSSGSSQGLYGIVWSGSQFVTVGDGGTILTSP